MYRNATLERINLEIARSNRRELRMVAMGFTVSLYAVAAIGLASVFALYDLPAERTFELVAIHGDGESDIVDHDLSATDCAYASTGKRNLICVAE